MNLFVSNLSYALEEADLRDGFAPFGQVIRVHLCRDKDTGASRGYAFVELATEEAGEQAVKDMNHTEFHGRTVYVQKARDEKR